MIPRLASIARNPRLWAGVTLTAGVLLVVDIVTLALSSLHELGPSADSWGYFELSHTIFSDFYRINTLRQTQYATLYGVSFPPLWPTIIASGRAVADYGIYTALAINVAISVTTLLLLLNLSRRFLGAMAPGVIVYAVLMAAPGYSEEILLAHSVPVQILLLTVLAHLFLRASERQFADGVPIAIVAGLMVLTRFDFQIAAIALVAYVGLHRRRNRMAYTAAYLGIFLLAVSPWIVYSLAHFGSFFVSDNATVVTAVEPVFVTDYIRDTIPTLLDDPITWSRMKLLGARGSYAGMVPTLGNPVFLVIVALVFGIVIASAIGRMSIHGDQQQPRAVLLRLLVLTAAVALTMLPVFLTGFGELRYALCLVECLGLLSIVSLLIAFRSNSTIVFGMLASFIIVHTVVLREDNLVARARSLIQRDVPIALDRSLTQPDGFASILRSIDNPSARVLFLDDGGRVSYRFGALTGYLTIPAPGNLDESNLCDLVDEYSVTHVVYQGFDAFVEEKLQSLREFYAVTRVHTAPYVYRLTWSSETAQPNRDAFTLDRRDP